MQGNKLVLHIFVALLRKINTTLRNKGIMIMNGKKYKQHALQETT